MHISLAAEPLFHLGWFPVTNSLLVSLVVSFLLILFAVIVSGKINNIPSKAQATLEMVVEYLANLAESIGGKNARKYLPLVITFFLFILLCNWIGLLPGFGSIGFYEVENGEKIFIPLFRGATADLNMTLALATISVVSTQIFGFSAQKLSYLKRFLNFDSPIAFFTGILELISEFVKIISFSFRLFGNIFAGEVLLTVITFLVPFIGPLPFFGLEIFVGLIQAFVFALLTLVFINIATQSHEGTDESEHEHTKLSGSESNMAWSPTLKVSGLGKRGGGA